MKKILTLSFLVVFLLSVSSLAFSKAKSPRPFAIQGMAIVHIKTSKMDLEFEQAVFIDEGFAMFVAVDDFGIEVFRTTFNKQGMFFSVADQLKFAPEKKFKKVLSLPLSQKEFLQIIRYKNEGTFLEIKDGKNIVWQKPKKKKLEIHLSDFTRTKKGRKFPKHVVIKYKKNSFDLQWIKFKKLT